MTEHHDSSPDWAAIGESIEREGVVYYSFIEQAIDWLREQLDEPVRILDVGSGPGVVTCALAEAFPDAEVVAVDGTPELLARAKARAERIGVRIGTQQADLPEQFDELGSADLIWISNVLHHLGDQKAALVQLAKHLSPGGVLALAEGGLHVRYLPRDFGIGRPGLASRLETAFEDSFAEMREELPGSTQVHEDWPALLAHAGLAPSATRSFLVDLPAPLDTEPRLHLRSVLERYRHRGGDRIDPADLSTVDRLLSDEDPAGLLSRPDVFLLTARTVHTARRDR